MVTLSSHTGGRVDNPIAGVLHEVLSTISCHRHRRNLFSLASILSPTGNLANKFLAIGKQQGVSIFGVTWQEPFWSCL